MNADGWLSLMRDDGNIHRGVKVDDDVIKNVIATNLEKQEDKDVVVRILIRSRSIKLFRL